MVLQTFHKNMKYLNKKWNDFQSDIEGHENTEGIFSISLRFWSFYSPLVSVFPVVRLLAKR